MERLLIEVKGDSEEELDRIFTMRRHEVSAHLAKCLLEALENGDNKFMFADVLFPDGQRVTLGCEHVDYYISLHKQIEILEEYEEYELCAKLKTCINILNEELNEI